MKQIIKKEFKFYGRKATTAFVMAIVFVTVAGTGFWALAAFTEPTTTPGNSVQDFAKNIMGANNADNAFDSSTVTANSDGSIVERLENVESKLLATAVSSEVSARVYKDASIYCRDLSATAETAIDGSNTSTTYTDWRLGSMIELSNFVGSTASVNYIWTVTPRDANFGTWMRLRLSDGNWHNNTYIASEHVRCVR